jgi:3-phosphoshikimate 1-carboxyvinyltransferase
VASAFRFAGRLPPSKSLLNRQLILRSHLAVPALWAESQAEDVRVCAQALRDLLAGREAWCASAGTAFRFCALRASRLAGTHRLVGRRRLFERPQDGLLSLLAKLGANAHVEDGAQPETRVLCIEGAGWRDPRGPIEVEATESSQFLSAVFLNAWNLEFPLEIRAPGLVSADYAQMSLELCRRAGMIIEDLAPHSWRIPAKQSVRSSSLGLEPDLSSAFVLAALAAVSGDCLIEDFPEASLQADARFVDILSAMRVPLIVEKGRLRFSKADSLAPWNGDLTHAPDLFPVLAVLCALAEGESQITGLGALKGKESDRLTQTRRLLEKLGRRCEGDHQTLRIFGRAASTGFADTFNWDPDQDHRLAFAAAVALRAGAPLRILHPEVVDKSYPSFWEDAGLRAPTTALIGHRGAGKSTLLGDLSNAAEVFDLDELISAATGRDLAGIFAEQGESAFRDHEQRALAQFMAPELLADAHRPRVIAVGAGADLAALAGTPTIWLRRDSDASGRVLLERPQWSKGEDPLQAFRQRYAARELAYAAAAWETFTLSEGSETSPRLRAFAAQFVEGAALDVGGTLTLLPENFGDVTRWQHFASRRARWNLDFVELRDDLLGAEALPLARDAFGTAKLLLSQRRAQTWLPLDDADLRADAVWDFDVDLELPSLLPRRFVRSLHEAHSGEDLAESLARLEKLGASAHWLKAAPIVRNWRELRLGHEWQAREPARRSFLPRSQAGAPSWAWYRLLRKGQQGLDFFREGAGSATDQPTLLERLSMPARPERFAAVLGSPVSHSRSPAEHGAGFVAIDLEAKDWSEETLAFLVELGLRDAAVTAPLKRQAWGLASRRSSVCEELGVANTLAWREGLWHADNTDLEGFRGLWHSLAIDPGASVLVWGGGGTLPLLRRDLPRASFYSVRSGAPREGSVSLSSVEVLVWAAGHDASGPPSFTQGPKLVVDLNYRADSAARVYAQRLGAQYVSGLVMFHRQAEAQRRFWSAK